MDDIFSGIKGIGNDSTTEVPETEVPAEDKTDLWMVLTNWIVVAIVALMLWGES